MDTRDTMVFVINGRKYTIEQIHVEAGLRRGYCKKRKKWVWIMDDSHLFFDGESPITAIRIK